MPKIERLDSPLADQIRRAASSVALNIAEGAYSYKGNVRLRFRTAAGSANEVRSALKVAVAWGYIAKEEVRGILCQLDEIVAMVWGMGKR